MFNRYMVNEVSNKVICVQKIRALSRMLHSALLNCKTLRNYVEQSGFKVNDYDLYAANQIINGKQHITACQLANVKPSHQDPKVHAFFSYRCRSCMAIQKVYSAHVKVIRGST
jgi:hypothetical protein